jgi:hypothetical protein
MRTGLVASALLVAALSPSAARAQNRVSVEIGGVVSAYDLDTAPGASRSGIRPASTIPDPTSMTPMSMAVAGVSTSGNNPTGAIAAAEVRPSISTDAGLLFAVGFRAGKAGIGDGSTALVGGDLSIGYQHRFGAFVPFVKGMFGFNSYDQIGNPRGHIMDLRLDAVLGTRLYVTPKAFLAAAAFAGWGDRYGGTLSVGADLVQFYRRGVMP